MQGFGGIATRKIVVEKLFLPHLPLQPLSSRNNCDLPGLSEILLTTDGEALDRSLRGARDRVLADFREQQDLLVHLRVVALVGLYDRARLPL